MRYPAALLIILALTVVLRIPTLFEPYWYGDEGIFGAVAAQMNRGARLYTQTFDNKPPFIYILYAVPFALFGTNLFAVKTLALLAVLFSQVFIYLFVTRSFGKRSALFATALLGLSVSIPIFEGNLALTETFMLPFTTTAFYCAFYQPKYLIWSGFLLSIAFLLKPIAFLEFFALFFFVFFLSQSSLRQKVVLCIGFILLPAVWSIYFALTDTFSDFFFASILFYTGYLQWTPRASQSPLDLAGKLVAPIAIALVLWIARLMKRLYSTIPTIHSRALVLLVLWLSSAWTATLFSGRPYSHYIIESLPPTAILFVILTHLIRARYLMLSVFVAFIMGVALFKAAVTFNIYNPFPYYRNFLAWATGAQSYSAYASAFDSTVNRNMALASWISVHSDPADYVYVWGDAPWVYALAPIRNPSRYVVSFHVLEIQPAKNQVMLELSNNPPRFIAVINSLAPFGEFSQVISDKYRVRERLDGVIVWERR